MFAILFARLGPQDGDSTMTMIMEDPADPVFLGGSSLIRLKIGRGRRGRIASLSARTARRLACALLLEAEKRETQECSHRTDGLVSTLDRAVAAVSKFQSRDERLRRRKKDRDFTKWLRKKQTQ